MPTNEELIDDLTTALVTELSDNLAADQETEMKLNSAGTAYDAINKKVENVAAPTNGNDAANKTYVDSATSLPTTTLQNTVNNKIQIMSGGVHKHLSGGVEVFRIANSTAVLFGKATGAIGTVGTLIKYNGQSNFVTDGAVPLSLNRKTTTGTILGFRYNDVEKGKVQITSTGTNFVTSSDYRLKENDVALTNATERLKSLRPIRFNFINEPAITVDGFMAHEVQSIVPEAVAGVKDEVNDEGEAEYQGIDQSRLVPLLVATIQELEQRITALEASN